MEEEVIEYKNSLKNVALENKIIKLISKQIKDDFPNLANIKFNIDLINDVCDCIEDMVDEYRLKKINKLELFIKIFESIFGGLSEPDKKIIVGLVESLHSNGKIRVRSRLSKIWRRYIKPLFSKKN